MTIEKFKVVPGSVARRVSQLSMVRCAPFPEYRHPLTALPTAVTAVIRTLPRLRLYDKKDF